jgi:SPP1 gp7 family putative phage head morphogenesis protein
MVDGRKLSAALRSPGRCRGVHVPTSLDMAFEAMWVGRQMVLWDQVIGQVLPLVEDSLVEDSVSSVRAAVARILSQYTDYTGFQLQLHTQYIRGANAHRAAFLSRVEDVIGVDVSSLLKDRSVDMAVRNRIRAGLALVKGLDRYTVLKMTEVVLSAAKTGEGVSIGELLVGARKVTLSRARLIARDQMGKFFGNLAQARQEDIGVTRYRWSTARDSRVRSRHAAREGKEYYWKRPPAGGPPGFDVNCRCVAEPVLESSRIVQEMRKAA